MLELVGEGSVINGATPSSLLLYFPARVCFMHPTDLSSRKTFAFAYITLNSQEYKKGNIFEYKTITTTRQHETQFSPGTAPILPPGKTSSLI